MEVPRALTPRKFPTDGFEKVDPEIKIEEESLPFYNPDLYYPVRLGDVYKSRYQVVAKLGYGVNSTTWLAHDLQAHRFVTLKIHVIATYASQERQVYQHINDIEIDHPGRDMIRKFEKFFQLRGPKGIHDVFVMEPMGLSLRVFLEHTRENRFEAVLVKIALQRVLIALNFLHAVANVTHTDIHPGNLLIGIEDESRLMKFEESELAKPSSRKVVDDTVIYVSQVMWSNWGPLFLTDFGAARVGDFQAGVAMPIQYRAPEVILEMPWNQYVDMWSVGILAWDLLETESLFSVYDPDNPAMNDAHHLAHMTALIGPPSADFRARGPRSSEFWAEDGTWVGPIPLPPRKQLADLERSLAPGQDRDNFLNFVGGLLRWEPEQRLESATALEHSWVSGLAASLGVV